MSVRAYDGHGLKGCLPLRRCPKARWVIHQARLPTSHVPTTASHVMPAPRSTWRRRVAEWRRTSVRLTLIRLSLTSLDTPSTGTHIPKACPTRTLQTIKLHWIGRTLSATSLTTGKGTTHDEAHHGCLSPSVLRPQASTGWGGSAHPLWTFV